MKDVISTFGLHNSAVSNKN